MSIFGGFERDVTLHFWSKPWSSLDNSVPSSRGQKGPNSVATFFRAALVWAH